MGIYLRHLYTTGVSDARFPYGYVGPFLTEQDARIHRRDYGPIQAEIVEMDTTGTDDHTQLSHSDVMTPTDHITYLEART